MENPILEKRTPSARYPSHLIARWNVQGFVKRLCLDLNPLPGYRFAKSIDRILLGVKSLMASEMWRSTGHPSLAPTMHDA